MIFCYGKSQVLYSTKPLVVITPRGNSWTSTPNGSVWTPDTPREVSKKYNYFIVLKEDSSFSLKTRVDVSFIPNFISYMNGDRAVMIKPENTKSISRITREGKQLLGIPADSCWLFKTVSGKINIYSFLPEEGFSFAIAIQKGEDSLIIPFTTGAVKDMVADDPKAFKMAMNKKYVQAIEQYNKVQ